MDTMDTTIEKVIHLQRIEMFADIPSEQMAHVAGIARDIRFAKGDVIFSEGDSSDALYILIDGDVKVTREKKMTRKIDKDEAFGIWGFFDRGPRLFTTEALEDSYLLKIDSADFFDLIEDRVHLTRGLIKYLVSKIRQLIEETDILV